MVKNIVFDLGNVLIDYDPSRIVNTVFADKKKQILFVNEIFLSKGWKQLDKGIICLEDHQQDLVSRYPQFAEEINWILRNWHKDLPNIPGMVSIVKDLNEKGLDLFILSNTGHRYLKYALSKKKFLRFFTGITISAELNLLKPQIEIYNRFCKIHELKPEECLFIDDQMENVQAAIAAGLKGYQFTDTRNLTLYLEKTLGVEV